MGVNELNYGKETTGVSMGSIESLFGELLVLVLLRKGEQGLSSAMGRTSLYCPYDAAIGHKICFPGITLDAIITTGQRRLPRCKIHCLISYLGRRLSLPGWACSDPMAMGKVHTFANI